MYRVSIYVVAVLAPLFLSGCLASSSQHHKSQQSAECRWNPDSCMYEGRYEANEEAYAEERARELNRASAQRMRVRSILGF